MKMHGTLSKMDTSWSGTTVQYSLILNEGILDLNSLIGKKIHLSFSGTIICDNCKKKTKKSYSQGYCYLCTMKLASCDLCILKPETCHYEKGTCREPSWGEENCLKPHIVYLANSSGLKVGITKKKNVPYRWFDQGAVEALPILEVDNRLTSGQVEVLFKKHIADKTDWRKMLKGEPESVDLISWRDKLLSELSSELKQIKHKILDEKVLKIIYPVDKYLEKISSFNLEKDPVIGGHLLGIKGQYMIFDKGVLNVRSHSGYQITIEET